MSFSMYQASVPVFTRSLKMLSNLLTKAEAHAKANGLKPEDLLEARLAPDMYHLTRQIQAAADAAKFGAARPAGVTPPSHPDTETSFADLQARITSVLEFINGIGEAAFAGSETREVALKTGSGELKFNGQDYLLSFALPNFFFHAVTAYDILRHKGLPLVKRDYLNIG